MKAFWNKLTNYNGKYEWTKHIFDKGDYNKYPVLDPSNNDLLIACNDCMENKTGLCKKIL